MFYHRHCWYSFPLSPCSQLFQNNGCPPFSISQFIIITSLSSPPCKTFSRASTTSTLQTVINISIFFQYQTSGEPLITLLPYSRNTIFFLWLPKKYWFDSHSLHLRFSAESFFSNHHGRILKSCSYLLFSSATLVCSVFTFPGNRFSSHCEFSTWISFYQFRHHLQYQLYIRIFQPAF